MAKITGLRLKTPLDSFYPVGVVTVSPASYLCMIGSIVSAPPPIIFYMFVAARSYVVNSIRIEV
jgi:hypothetical protein